jgi:Cu/Ag efflux protein CusF
MWRIAMLTTAIGMLMSVNGQVKADSLPPAVAGGSVEGTISKVDAVSGTIQISSGLLGLVGKTLQLSEDTLVKIGDREASLTEISEGSKVTAFYETRNRKYIATYIDLVPKFRMPERPFNVDPRIAL